jgi:hypothetical protein
MHGEKPRTHYSGVRLLNLLEAYARKKTKYDFHMNVFF